MSHSKHKEEGRFVLTLKEAPHKRSICETKMRYDIVLRGEVVAEVFYNMTGYVVVPGLPLPGGRYLSLPECGITRIKSEIRKINSEAKQAQNNMVRVRPRLRERLAHYRGVQFYPARHLFPQSVDVTDYAKACGYRGGRRVRVLDGKVISHLEVDWFAFLDKVREGIARRPLMQEAQQ